MKTKTYEKFIVAILTCFTSASLFGYNLRSFLMSGDEALLLPPTTTFALELARMKLDTPKFHAFQPTNGVVEATGEADIGDLEAALQKKGLGTDERKRVTEGYSTSRAKLRAFDDAINQWQWNSRALADGQEVDARASRPRLPNLDIPAEVPAEFADSLRADLAWRNGSTNEAREIWKALLERPANERRYRSTCAAYMLGFTSGADQPGEAIKYYTLTRSLAAAGFKDSFCKAAASIGWEARVNLTQHKFERAMELYLEHYATGDESAPASLRFTAHFALTNGVEALVPLTRNPRTQKVITAYITSGWVQSGGGEESAKSLVRDWLEAISRAGTRNLEFAEQYALAAYQNGDFELAGRWAELARHSPAAEWVQAKLMLRSGKTHEAEGILARLAERFPLQKKDTNDLGSLTFSQCLTMSSEDLESDKPSAARQIRGELGILRLSNGEYIQALDDLLHGDWLVDANYAAERVLTIDELKSYVDANWPDIDPPADGSPDPDASARESVRTVLGRRLCRLNRGSEAGVYFPRNLQPVHADLMSNLTGAWEESRPAGARAESFFASAMIVEENGRSLLGTTVAPDGECLVFSKGEELAPQCRSTNELMTLMRPSSDETQRYEAHKPEPDLRGHYHYQAASLAWEASKLMPDNSEATAKVLWTAGTWMKYKDPKFADLFYKTLVKRCRKTTLGAAADEMRWFPRLDAAGNLIPRPVRANPAPEEPMPEPADTASNREAIEFLPEPPR